MIAKIILASKAIENYGRYPSANLSPHLDLDFDVAGPQVSAPIHRENSAKHRSGE
jgi:hypothetical protein